MQIVFMNRMSKAGGAEERFAQLWIGEEEGIWRLGWREFEGPEAPEDVIWYEGGSWSEMLCVYRHELAIRMGEGYRPLIDGAFEEEQLPAKGLEPLRLQFYSEQCANEQIYEELCSWRRSRASAARKAPYLLASNRLLRLLSTFLPRTVEELLQIPGIGEGKAAEFGDQWLEITSKAERGFGFPLDWVREATDEEAFASWLYKQKEQKYKRQLERLRLRRLLVQGIEAGFGLEELREKSGVNRRELIEAVEELERDGYSVDPLIDKELSAMPEEERESVRLAFGELGDLFLKPVLHKVYGPEFTAAGGLDSYYEKLRLIRIRFRRDLAGSESPAEEAG